MSLRTYYENMPDDEIGRRMRELDFFTGTSLQTPPPGYDPIFTPLFSAIGFTGAFTVAGVTITTAGLASTIATTAVTAGVHLWGNR